MSHVTRISLIALLWFVPISAVAQDSELCGDVLKYSAKDINTKVEVSDQRKYYYQKVCKEKDTSLGIDYKDASAALGLSYANKSDYCKTEESIDNKFAYSKVDSSIVVREALSAYVQCRALYTNGVATSITMPSDNPTIFSVAVQRKSPGPQRVQTVTFDPDNVSCSIQKEASIVELKSVINDISFDLPADSSKWPLMCARKKKTDAAGNATYGPVQLILHTSAGNLTVSLSPFGVASPAWASDLRAQSNQIITRLDALKSMLGNTKIVAQCSGDGYFPRPPAPACSEGFTDSGQFSHSAPGGPGGFGGNCRICMSPLR